NMDIIVTSENQICIIDIGARMGGNLISSHIIPLSSGYDYLGNLIKATMNDMFEKPTELEQNVVTTRLLSLQPGKIISLPNFDEIEKRYKTKIYFNKDKGDTIRDYRNNLDGCGYILSVDKNLDQSVKK